MSHMYSADMDRQSVLPAANETSSKQSDVVTTGVTAADRIVDGAKLVAVLLVIGCVAYHANLSGTGKRDMFTSYTILSLRVFLAIKTNRFN